MKTLLLLFLLFFSSLAQESNIIAAVGTRFYGDVKCYDRVSSSTLLGFGTSIVLLGGYRATIKDKLIEFHYSPSVGFTSYINSSLNDSIRKIKINSLDLNYLDFRASDILEDESTIWYLGVGGGRRFEFPKQLHVFSLFAGSDFKVSENSKFLCELRFRILFDHEVETNTIMFSVGFMWGKFLLLKEETGYGLRSVRDIETTFSAR